MLRTRKGTCNRRGSMGEGMDRHDLGKRYIAGSENQRTTDRCVKQLAIVIAVLAAALIALTLFFLNRLPGIRAGALAQRAETNTSHCIRDFTDASLSARPGRLPCAEMRQDETRPGVAGVNGNATATKDLARHHARPLYGATT